MMAVENQKQPNTGNEYIDVSQGKGHTRIYISTGRVIWNNFLGGLSWGFGTVLGATVVVGLVLFILTKLNTVPFIGDVIKTVIDQIQSTSQVP